MQRGLQQLRLVRKCIVVFPVQQVWAVFNASRRRTQFIQPPLTLSCYKSKITSSESKKKFLQALNSGRLLSMAISAFGQYR